MNARQATNYIPDETSPRLVNFTLDMNTGLIEIFYTDVVNNEIFDPTQITLRGSRNASDTSTVYRLTGGNTASTNGFSTLLQLSNTDLNVIKQIENLATNENDTFISLAAELVRDVANQPIRAIIPENSEPVARLIPDENLPLLNAFYLSINQETIIFQFNETVDISSFMPSEIVLQNRQDIVAATQSVNLTGGVSNPSDRGVIFVLSLLPADVEAIKLLNDLGTSVSNTYLAMPEGSILDTSGNLVIEIPSSSALRASNHTPDSTPPQLNNYTFDLNEGKIYLTFSESVSYISVMPVEFSILSEAVMSSSTELRRLTGGTVSMTNNPLINALRTINFIPDILPPTIAAFDLLVGEGQLRINFSESIEKRSVDLVELYFTVVKT